MTFRMSHKELDRYQLVQRCIRRELTESKTAGLLKLSLRHVQRLKRGVRERGPVALIHGNRGKKGNRRIPDCERQRIASLLHERYHDFGPTLAAEKLEAQHAIDRDPKTIRGIMMAEHLWKPKQKRSVSEHRAWRQRKDCFGELVQFDGSYEYWFEGRGDSCCLLAAIDDATGTVAGARFVTDEGVIPVFSFWKEYLSVHGKPRAIYLDKLSTYRMHITAARENSDSKTQFQRAAESLAIEPLFANSPQAKGRVERLFGTLQDRLIKELRLEGISDMGAANQFLVDTFIPWFNRRFAVAPRRRANLHQPLTQRERSHLDSTFSRHTEHVVQNDYTVQHRKRFYQLSEHQPVTVYKKDTVTVEEWLDQTIHIRLRGKELNYRILPARPKRPLITSWVLAATAPQHNQRPPYRPAPDHLWKRRIHAEIQAHQLSKVGHF